MKFENNADPRLRTGFSFTARVCILPQCRCIIRTRLNPMLMNSSLESMDWEPDFLAFQSEYETPQNLQRSPRARRTDE